MQNQTNRLIPASKWDNEKYADISLSRLFSIINHNQLAEAISNNEWGCSYDCIVIVNYEKSRLPMIQVYIGFLRYQIDVSKTYICRLLINSIVENQPYVIGHFRPYLTNYILVITRNDFSPPRVIRDFDRHMINADPSLVDPFCWMRADFKLNR